MGLQYCRLPKTGSTILLSALCDMQREFRGINFTQVLNSTFLEVKNDCWYNKTFYRTHKTEKWAKPKRKVKFIIVRDPVERFVSLYSYICLYEKLCPKRTGIQKFAQDIYNAYRGENNYIRTRPPIWGHVSPQANFCQLRKRWPDFDIVYHSREPEILKDQLLDVFRKAQIPEETAERALRHITMGSTTHATSSDSDCWSDKAFYRNHKTETWRKSKRQVKFLIVREPIDRFVSMYSFICLHEKLCPKRTGIQKFAQDIYNAYRGENNYIRTRKPIWGHVSPQANHCNLKKTWPDFDVVYYSREPEILKDQLLDVFRKAEIPEEISQRALRHITMGQTYHVTDLDQAKALKDLVLKSSSAKSLVTAIYHKDYKIFGPFP
ncbi:unnamed protein product, partial [Mesorhabditis spiculigera]